MPSHAMPCLKVFFFFFLQDYLSQVKQKILLEGECQGHTSSCFLPLRRVTRATLIHGLHPVEGHQSYSSSCFLSLWMVPSLTPYLYFLLPGMVLGTAFFHDSCHRKELWEFCPSHFIFSLGSVVLFLRGLPWYPLYPN